MPMNTLDVDPEDLEPLELEALRPSEPDALPRLDLPDPEDDGDALELSAPLETLIGPTVTIHGDAREIIFLLALLRRNFPD
jgi:hypothetical protein